MNQMSSLRQMMTNAATRQLSTLFPGYFNGAKHDHYADFGWPETLEFENFFQMYRRNSLGSAVVKKTIRKTWETPPVIRESEDHDLKESTLEKIIRKRLNRLRTWQTFAEADRRAMVGRYSGIVMRLADSKPLNEPVDRVPGGLDGLVELIPAWQSQLQVAEWVEDRDDPDFGKPRMYMFNEAQVGDSDPSANTSNRQMLIHPDRVIVWSDTGSLHDRPKLEPCYNDLLTIEKIVGSGGEGFWKNAKSGLSFEIDKETKLRDVAATMGVGVDEIVETMNDQVEDFNKGFDKALLLQGMKVNSVGVSLPSPEHFHAIALQGVAGALEIPIKILIGMQTGERASQEDADEWAQTCMGRRSDSIIPGIWTFLERLEDFGMIPERDWFVSWSDLTESSMDEKIDRADKMAGINQKNGDEIYTAEEIREVTNHPSEGLEDDDSDDNLEEENEE